ncbi:MAG: three-Cys-motif partner protein TcmP [Pseudoxanthomonas sp.]|uniref:three-Cys-motif partner protein TcmP n=1 Tax=Pseudoxanthomonas TaxID=83618 RepID=UPI00138A38C2|nr:MULTISPECIES: three-Cys-motif partner protein TcmP [Pseudoxanthomonas]MCH2092393.1 three-Cys-motif partner protein TcmP [Pseudoxanthomonas sp.]
MTKSSNERYQLDSDGTRIESVGAWSQEKHDRLRKYVDITRRTRAKFVKAGSTYIDLYCGPGKVQIKGEAVIKDGGAVLAVRESAKDVPFTEVHVGDLDRKNVDDCLKGVAQVGAVTKVFGYQGKAEETAVQITSKLHRYGLHLAFLDPYNLNALPFSIIRTLATLERMDMIIHVSEMDLNRNIRLYKETGVLEAFAPGVVERIDWRQKDEIVRQGVFAHWRSLLESLDYKVGGAERVTGDKNQPFYWLVSVSRNDLGKKFWDEIRQVEPQRGFSF